jgi:hypothetical protein
MRSRFHLTLPQHLAQEPVIYRLGREFGVVTNITRASVEERFAWVILELEGEEDAIERAVAWLADQDVDVDRIAGAD